MQGVRVAAILTVVLLLAACDGDAVDGGGTTVDATASSGDPAEVLATTGTSVETTIATPAGPDGGISLEEAEDTGVLTGSHDALLVGPVDVEQDGDCVVAVVVLRNVGQEPDHYVLTTTPDIADVTPADVAVEPGHEAEVTVRLCEDVEDLLLEATSESLQRVVAQLRFG